MLRRRGEARRPGMLGRTPAPAEGHQQEAAHHLAACKRTKSRFPSAGLWQTKQRWAS